MENGIIRPRLPIEADPIIDIIKQYGADVCLQILEREIPKLNNSLDFELEDGEDDTLHPLNIQGIKMLTLSDTHFPYHHLIALKTALQEGKNFGVDVVYLNGDIMDCYQVSKHSKDIRKRNMRYEIYLTKQFLQLLRHNFKNAQIFYKFGNHEYRWERFLQSQAPEMLGITEIELATLLQLNNYGIQYVEQNRIAKFGKLNIAHGHEYRSIFGGGINNARNTRIKAGNHNVLIGHYHRTQEDIAKDIDDNFTGSWVTGCLCKLNPLYAGKTQWNWGYALIEQSGGKFEVYNKKIIV